MMSFESIVNMVPQADESMGITIFCLTYLLLVFNNVSLNILGCLGLIINFSPSLLSAAGTDQMEVQRDFELKDGNGGTATVAMKGGQLVDLFSSVHEHSKNASSFLFFFFLYRTPNRASPPSQGYIQQKLHEEAHEGQRRIPTVAKIM